MEKIESKERRIYFDWAASSPYRITSALADVPFGNPSSQHSEGRAAKLALEDARERCAAVLKVPPETLYFTSGGTESNAIALFSNLTRPGKGRVISSFAEHSSVREGMETLEKMGKPTGRVAVNSAGSVTAETLTKALEKNGDVRFAAIMSVNNETGAVTDITSLTNLIHKKTGDGAPIHFHCDLVQAVGKIPVDISSMEIDSASISAHKISGPRGIGLLYLKKPLGVFYTGGGQEKGIRGGTENTVGAVALAECLEKYAGETVQAEYISAKSRWKKLIIELSKIERFRIIPRERTAEDDRFSPYILQAAFKDIPGEVMARALNDLGFAVSTGSACSSSSPERPVLAAMGIEENLRIEGIRISQGWSTTDEEIDLLICAIAEVLKFL
ncbi:MAG: aminotransferase class V-fold PLP-dependent enzyme [Treponema sp.]|jgi:cysteine desulfurase|nr:aminotransferase class V-fold PLP-dependent enzyme [Treponema sp.]